MKKFLILIVLLVLALCVCGCKKDTQSQTITVTDMEGTLVEVPKNVSRVACISQSATDFMIAFFLFKAVLNPKNA